MTRHTHTLAASDPEPSQACATAQTAISTYDCRGKKDHKLYSLVVDFYTNTMVWAGLPFGNLRAVDEEEPDRCAKACFEANRGDLTARLDTAMQGYGELYLRSPRFKSYSAQFTCQLRKD